MKKTVRQKSTETPFDVREGRVMVSLGPLAPNKYCTYRCPFCYVNTDFLSYASMTVTEIVEWLRGIEDSFDLIYVSGDTDSFAPPRADIGLDLLTALTEFRRDLLFTTRAVLTERQLERLASIRLALSNVGKLLIGCVSVAQLTHPHLEPPPVPPPVLRLQQLRRFHELRLASVLV